MSRTGRNFVVAYILLVGLPLLGLAGVLKVGRGISAPTSIDGTWKLDADTSVLAAQPCGKTISSLLSSSLVISQSGKTLVLTSNSASKTTAMGTLQGKDIAASFATAASSTPGCGTDSRISLAAVVDPKSDPRTLSGTLLASDCASCGSVPFHAVRQPKPVSGGLH